MKELGVTLEDSLFSPFFHYGLAGIFYCAFIFFALVSPVLPWSLMWRALAVSILCLTAGRLLEGPTHWSDQNVSYVLGLAVLLSFVGAIGIALILRLAISVLIKFLRRDAVVKKSSGSRSDDTVILILTGGVAGLAAAIGLAQGLGGLPWGRSLDIGIGVVSLAAAIAFVPFYRKAYAAPSIAFFLVIGTIAFAGSGQSDQIIRQAEELADGRPWCLTGQTKAPPITSTGQLGFFSLRKPRLGPHRDPHLALLIKGADRIETAHWSIRKQTFISGLNTGVPACSPRLDYARALSNGEIAPTAPVDMFRPDRGPPLASQP
ncbi:MAG: hypothetical protein VYD57_04175 [Pseudomonadota bacterium]|nr:hypothetical protein [Pseudomonadota bacterium]